MRCNPFAFIVDLCYSNVDHIPKFSLYIFPEIIMAKNYFLFIMFGLILGRENSNGREFRYFPFCGNSGLFWRWVSWGLTWTPWSVFKWLVKNRGFGLLVNWLPPYWECISSSFECGFLSGRLTGLLRGVIGVVWLLWPCWLWIGVIGSLSLKWIYSCYIKPFSIFAAIVT